METHQFLFVTGLHRSGTSPLYRTVRQHPQISGFSNTGVSEDEGQHLQTVLPRGGAYGGPGRFGRDPKAHMTESHPMANRETAAALFAQWRPYWDLSKPVLAEKTPITLTRTRLFQALFPKSHFVVLLRHPLAVALATYNVMASGGTAPELTLEQLLEHWVLCYEIFRDDAPYLHSLAILPYEEFAAHPQPTLDMLTDTLGLDRAPVRTQIQPHINACYLAQWRAMRQDPQYAEDIERAMRLEERIRAFGYSLTEEETLRAATAGPFANVDAPLPILETPRLLLRQMTFADLDAFASLCADPETMRYFDGPMPREQAWGKIAESLQDVQRDGFSFWAVFDKATKAFIGQCGLKRREVNGRLEVELGYRIGRGYWGHGIATEAAQATLTVARQRFGIGRVLAVINEHNIASRRVAEKCGMQLEKQIPCDEETCCVYVAEPPA